MGHYNKDGVHMESAKQERHNLLHDNPVVRDASGGRPWISKHFQSTMSPLKGGHLPNESESPAMEKMKMVKGPDGKMVPHFAVDGEGPNDEKKGMSMKMGSSNSAVEAHCMGKKK